MDYPNHTTNSCKHKHLNYQERVIIQIRLNDYTLRIILLKNLNMLLTLLEMKLYVGQFLKSSKRKLGTNIEKRPTNILTREEFGHWEIDTVIGREDKMLVFY